MELVERIQDQLAGNPHPLFAITVAAVPCPDTPIILTLHWHGFVRERATALAPVPSSALQVNDRWADLEELDRAALDAGWELGAWDVARAERRACTRPGAESRESLECLQAFGAFPFGLDGISPVVADAPDADDLLDAAARHGYLMWLFRPVHRGVWKDVADDVTLDPQGRREPPCPVSVVPPRCRETRKTVYRFGVSSVQAGRL